MRLTGTIANGADGPDNGRATAELMNRTDLPMAIAGCPEELPYRTGRFARDAGGGCPTRT